MIIDEKIKSRLLSLNELEYDLLEKSILKEGCRDPLIFWKKEDGSKVLIDGHHRYEICKKHFIDFESIEMKFNDIDEVLNWVDINQLGKRNLTDEQRTYLIGRIYKSRKRSFGGDRKSDDYGKSSGQNVNLKTSQIVADEFNISDRTIIRAEKYADAIDEIERTCGTDVKDQILKQEFKITKQDIVKIAEMDPFEQEDVISKIKLGDVVNLKEAKKVLEIDNRRKTINKHNNNLYLGDCVEILQSFEPKTIDCVVMDPPYLIDYVDTRESFNPSFNDSSENKVETLDNWFKEIKRVVKDDAHIYCFYGIDEDNTFYKCLNKYFETSVIPIIWVKNNHTMCDFDKTYASKYEPIYFSSNGKRKLKNKVSPNVLQFNIPTKKLHKTQKPVDLLEYFISNSTVEGEIVLDPFMGSGSTCLAAKNLNRKYVGIEIEPDIYNIAVERLG